MTTKDYPLIALSLSPALRLYPRPLNAVSVSGCRPIVYLTAMTLAGYRMCNHDHQQVDAGITMTLFLLGISYPIPTYPSRSAFTAPSVG